MLFVVAYKSIDMALQMPMKMMHKPNKWLTFERSNFLNGNEISKNVKKLDCIGYFLQSILNQV